ncbi:MAG TPA: HEAT repeat domain-containing protein [Candidatus Hydrogenedentes bacterium]|nr:HEAT repeat domain-containing protein [Candidatus Hydrogenedentota bacterium]
MRYSIALLILAGTLITVSAAVFAQEAGPVQILQSDAPVQAKGEACRTLSIHPDIAALPALAALLTDETLSHMARYALEPMPYPEVNPLLREALGKTSGRVKGGIISSLGFRKDTEAVPLLIPLLTDADLQVAQIAAGALGDIGVPEIVVPLEAVIGQADAPAGNRQACSDALMTYAEKLSAQEGPEVRRQAYDMYAFLFGHEDLSKTIHAAAMRGMILCLSAAPWREDGSDAAPKLVEALRAEDEDLFAMGLRAAREMKQQDAVSTVLAGALSDASPERKVRIIQALGQCGGVAAGLAVFNAAKEGPVEVRVAAVNALARMEYQPSLDLIAQLAISGEDELVKAARKALCYFPNGGGKPAIKAMCSSDQAAMRLVGIELIGQGGLDKPNALLLQIAENDSGEDVRVAALQVLKNSAGIEEMPALVSGLLKGRSAAEMQAGENALRTLCERQKKMPGEFAIVKALYGDLPDGQQADVLTQVTKIVKSGSLAVTASNAAFGDPAPGLPKKLQIDYTDKGTIVSKTILENETLKLASASAPAAMVDAFCAAFGTAQGEAKLAMLRLLGSTGSAKAFETVRAAAAAEDAAVKDTALRTLCDWPAPEALPVLMELCKTADDPAIKPLALRGTVRLLSESTGDFPIGDVLERYTELMGLAQSADDKKVVLGGLAQVAHPKAFEMALARMGDAEVRTEAVQAALNVAKIFGKAPREDAEFFNPANPTGWQGDIKLWRLEDGVIVAQSDGSLKHNEFLWSGVEAGDFYLAVDVLIEPNAGNGGVQFRSQKANETGQAQGYQGDIGQDVWGRLYHEHGRGKLDWPDSAEQAVKPGEWNHLEILAVGPAIWTAINGKLGVAFLDLASEERSGRFALQLHAGPPQTIRYKIVKLVHDPKIELPGIPAETLISELRAEGKQ